jgi:micrococcal nuclease
MFEYHAKVLKIVDGDTIDVMVDLGMGVHRKERLRFSRINAWETRGTHKAKGKLAKARVAELIPIGEKILVKTEKDKRGKYGRYIAEIYFTEEDVDVNLNDLLLNEGHAVLYNKK